MSLFNQVFCCQVAAQPVIRANAVKKTVVASIAVNQNRRDLILFVLRHVAGGIGAQDNHAVQRPALYNVDIALPGIGARKDQMIARLPDFQLHCAQECTIKGIFKHDVGFFALVFRLGDHNPDQLGLNDSLRPAGAKGLCGLIGNVVQLFHRIHDLLTGLWRKG